MGVGNLKPSGTLKASQSIQDYRELHISTTEVPEDRIIFKESSKSVLERMISDTALEKVKDKYTNSRDSDKVLARTRHGIELRIRSHPNGALFFFLVVVSDSCSEANLAMSHIEQYQQKLKKALSDVYGDVRKSTGAWTSKSVVEANSQ